MRRMLTICSGAILLLSGSLSARGQVDPRPFNPIAESVENAIKDEFPNHKRTSIPPAQPEGALVAFPEDVIIDQWRSDEALVRVAILIHPSKEEATKALRRFTANVKVISYLQDVGNESYVWGMEQSVVFRKGIYTVYVSVVPLHKEDEPENSTPLIDRAQYGETFAKVVARTLKDQ